jgi:hypothetical protein
MEKLSIIDLLIIKNKLVKEGKQDHQEMIDVLNYISIKERMILEDGTSATGGPSIGGMGQVVSAQPSGLAGSTIGTNWSSYGGKAGSGDPSAKTVAIAYQQPAGSIAAPYNPSGSNRVFQDVEMGKNHGAMTGKKTRKKRISMSSLKDIFTKRNDFMADQEKSGGSKKVMNFDDFKIDDITKVKK